MTIYTLVAETHYVQRSQEHLPFVDDDAAISYSLQSRVAGALKIGAIR